MLPGLARDHGRTRERLRPLHEPIAEPGRVRAEFAVTDHHAGGHGLVDLQRVDELRGEDVMRDERAGARVVEHVQQLVLLGQRVDGHEHRAALERRVDADHGLDAVVDERRDAVAALHATRTQELRQRVRLAVDLRVRISSGPALERHLRAMVARGVFQRLMQKH
jgi:hypothetical protein